MALPWLHRNTYRNNFWFPVSIFGIVFTEVTSPKNSVQKKPRNECHKQIVPNTKGIVNALSYNLNFVYKWFSIRSWENAFSLRLKIMGIEWSRSSKKTNPFLLHGMGQIHILKQLYAAYYFIDLPSELLLSFERNGFNIGTKMRLSPVVAFHLLF